MKIKSKYEFDAPAIQNIIRQLSSPKKICIITPLNSDGDIIGSSLAIAILLSQKMGHEVTVLTLNQILGLADWMVKSNQVISFYDQNHIAKSAIQKSEVLFYLGFSNVSQLTGMSESIWANHSAAKILISNKRRINDILFDFSFCFPDACALAELTFLFCQELELTHLIDKPIADCFYSGIVAGSGSFKLDSVTPELHEIEAELLRKGADATGWIEVSNCYYENGRKPKTPDCTIENFLERKNDAKYLSDAGHLF